MQSAVDAEHGDLAILTPDEIGNRGHKVREQFPRLTGRCPPVNHGLGHVPRHSVKPPTAVARRPQCSGLRGNPHVRSLLVGQYPDAVTHDCLAAGEGTAHPSSGAQVGRRTRGAVPATTEVPQRPGINQRPLLMLVDSAATEFTGRQGKSRTRQREHRESIRRRFGVTRRCAPTWGERRAAERLETRRHPARGDSRRSNDGDSAVPHSKPAENGCGTAPSPSFVREDRSAGDVGQLAARETQQVVGRELDVEAAAPARDEDRVPEGRGLVEHGRQRGLLTEG